MHHHAANALLQQAPRPTQAVERTDRVHGGGHHQQVGRPGPRCSPLQAGRHHGGPRFEAAQHVVNGVGFAQYVMGEMKQRRVGLARNGRRLNGCVQQRHVGPGVRCNPGARLGQHFGALLHANDVPAGAHRLLQLLKAQAGTAANIQNGGTGSEREPCNGVCAHRLKGQQLQVIDICALAVLLQGKRMHHGFGHS